MVLLRSFIKSIFNIIANVFQLAPSGAGICRCLSGWNHSPGGNTIDGCPVKISDTKSAPPSRPRPRPASRPRPRPTSNRRY